MRDTSILILGSGLMGRAAAWYMDRKGMPVTLVDADRSMLEAASTMVPNARLMQCAVEDHGKLAPEIKAATVTISCVPYTFNEALTRLAIEGGSHFIDLGGNNDVVDAQFTLDQAARDAGVTVIPDCGLAPGMLSVWAMEGANSLDECFRISMYCGGLPQNPQPPLNYMRLFSVNGLINEYIEPCRIIRDGKRQEVPGMSGLEHVEFDEPVGRLEAFFTSGGTSTLVETLGNRLDELEYKTLRFPGHIQFFQSLHALGFLSEETLEGTGHSPRQISQELLHRHLPGSGADMTVFRVDCEGELEGRPAMIRFECVDKADDDNGLSSMMRCTAFPAAEIALMLASGTIASPGTQPQELVVPPEQLRDALSEYGIIVERFVSTEYEDES